MLGFIKKKFCAKSILALFNKRQPKKIKKFFWDKTSKSVVSFMPAILGQFFAFISKENDNSKLFNQQEVAPLL